MFLTSLCSALNDHLIHFIFCHVIPVPTKITLPPEDVTLTGQAVVIFHCGVESDPSTPVSLTWLRGNKEIVYDLQRIYLLANHSLVLNLTNEEDSGNSFVAQYTCHATNGLDEDSQSAKLRPAFVLPIRRDESTVLPGLCLEIT